jgi:hypothetical protein
LVNLDIPNANDALRRLSNEVEHRPLVTVFLPIKDELA